MADKRKVYSREFKEQAVEFLNTSGKPGNQIEAELGIGSGAIYSWRRRLQEDGPRAFPGNGNERDRGLVEKTQNTFEGVLTRVPLVVKPPRRRGVSAALLDRVAEHSHILTTKGTSYRTFKQRGGPIESTNHRLRDGPAVGVRPAGTYSPPLPGWLRIRAAKQVRFPAVRTMPASTSPFIIAPP